MADITTSATIVSTTTGSPITTTTAAPSTTTSAPSTTTGAPVVSGVENDLTKNAAPIIAQASTVDEDYKGKYLKIYHIVLFSLSLVLIILSGLLLFKFFISTKTQIFILISFIISLISTILLGLQIRKIKIAEKALVNNQTKIIDEKNVTTLLIFNSFISFFLFILLIL